MQTINGSGWMRDSLIEKMALEASEAVKAASLDGLTGFHSEAEVKCRIRDELNRMSMTDEMVQALYAADNVLDDACRFCMEADLADQVFLAVSGYLEKTERDYLAKRAFDRVTLEYNGYIDKAKAMPADKIVEEMYAITALYDLHISLEPGTSDFSTERLRALDTLDSPLWSLYEEWMSRDCTHMDEIKDVILTVADERLCENAADRSGAAPDLSGIGGLEDGDGDGLEP